jgi:hypothetical protein
MYETTNLERVGLFQINDSCKSIDVTKDSNLLFATATTKGIKVFDVNNGDQLVEMEIFGMKTSRVALSYSDKYFLVIYEEKNRESAIKIFKVKDALDHGVQKGCCQPEY